jgi:ribosomal protein S18 acetylase RimI-like enzyme
MDFAENYAAEKGFSSIRLDAYSGNSRALNLYERRGFRRVGQFFSPRRELPFYCYEKVLIKE